jgi:uncharacterized protein YegL
MNVEIVVGQREESEQIPYQVADGAPLLPGRSARSNRVVLTQKLWTQVREAVELPVIIGVKLLEEPQLQRIADTAQQARQPKYEDIAHLLEWLQWWAIHSGSRAAIAVRDLL